MWKRRSVGCINLSVAPWQLNPTPGGGGRKIRMTRGRLCRSIGRNSRERQARRWVRRLTITWISDMRKGQKSSIQKMLAPLIQFPWKCLKKALLLRVILELLRTVDEHEGYKDDAPSFGTLQIFSMSVERRLSFSSDTRSLLEERPPSYHSTDDVNNVPPPIDAINKFSRADTIWILAGLWSGVLLGAFDGTLRAGLSNI